MIKSDFKEWNKIDKKFNFHNKNVGNYGERIACEYLEKQGYNIIDRNFFTRNAEIDIIAINKDEYVFIEVKTRLSKKYGSPVEAVDKNKIKHITNAAKYYIYKNHLENKNIRFDVIEVYITEKVGNINHIKNVFF